MITVNFIAILVAAISKNLIGSLWFGFLFKKSWPTLAGLPVLSKQVMMKAQVLQFAGSFLMAFVFAHSLEVTTHHLTSGTGSVDSVIAACEGAFLIWLGFIAPASMGAVIRGGKTWKWWRISVGYYLVSLLVMGVILALWR